MHNHMNSATLYRTTDSCEISEHGTSLLKIPLLLYHNTCVGFAEARPIDVETSSLVYITSGFTTSTLSQYTVYNKLCKLETNRPMYS